MTLNPELSSAVEIPVVPSVEVWRAMSPAAREAFVVAMNEALTEAVALMPEGQPHKKAKSRALDLLGRHFQAKGRAVYLAEELSVLYPNERGFAPDVLAVVGVEQPEDDERLAWVVAEEGRGLDVVLEVLHHGDRDKDLVFNVERYARLGIPEYFVYDRAQQRVVGYRLPTPEARRYERVLPQGGRLPSRVLGVALAVEGNRLCFWDGTAQLFSSDDLIQRLNAMVDSLESKADAARTATQAALDAAEVILAAERAAKEAALAELAQLRAELARRG